MFKHFKRLMNGALSITIIVGFISIILGIGALIDDFVKWRYRDTTLDVLLIIAILYFTGMLVELFSET